MVAKPYQKPYPEIVGTVVAPSSSSATFFGQKGIHPLSANFLMPKWLKSHWDAYAGRARAPSARRSARPTGASRARSSSPTTTRPPRAMRCENPNSPYRFYYFNLLRKFRVAKRLAGFKQDREQPDAEITDDYVVDRLVMHGSVNNIVDQILALHEETGPFGELVYAGHGLGRSGTDQALHGADGNAGDAARQRGARRQRVSLCRPLNNSIASWQKPFSPARSPAARRSAATIRRCR